MTKTKLEDSTTAFNIRIFNEDFAAFERIRESLPFPADQLGRIIWHLAIWKSDELVSEAIRIALAGPKEKPEDGVDNA